MEFPKSFLLLGLVVLYVFASVTAADINQQKKVAIDKMDAHIKRLKEYAARISSQVDKSDNAQSIMISYNIMGYWIYEDFAVNINRYTESANMLANLMGSSNNVLKCIKDRQTEAIDASDKYYYETFKDAMGNCQLKGEENQRAFIKTWTDDYSKQLYQYSKLYDKSVLDIKKATTESAISTIVKNFEKAGNQITEVINSILPKLNKLHLDILTAAEQIYLNYRKYESKTLDETSKAIQKCFPKFYQHEIFLNPKLF